MMQEQEKEFILDSLTTIKNSAKKLEKEYMTSQNWMIVNAITEIKDTVKEMETWFKD